MHDRSRDAIFERAIVPHLDAAFNLARWLTRNDQDAEDVVQDACLRAFRSLDGLRGTDGRAWMLAIVRNSAYTWLGRNRMRDLTTPFDEAIHDRPTEEDNPEALLLRQVDRQRLSDAVEALPVEFREVLVLRELEGLSYKEIAQVAEIPIGTVMSRLARARRRLADLLGARGTEIHREV